MKYCFRIHIIKHHLPSAIYTYKYRCRYLFPFLRVYVEKSNHINNWRFSTLNAGLETIPSKIEIISQEVHRHIDELRMWHLMVETSEIIQNNSDEYRWNSTIPFHHYTLLKWYANPSLTQIQHGSVHVCSYSVCNNLDVPRESLGGPDGPMAVPLHIFGQWVLHRTCERRNRSSGAKCESPNRPDGTMAMPFVIYGPRRSHKI